LSSVSEPSADEAALRFPIGIRRSDQEFTRRFLSEPMQAHPVPQEQFCDVRHCCLSGGGRWGVEHHRAPPGDRWRGARTPVHRSRKLQSRSRDRSRGDFKSEDIRESALYKFLSLLALDFGRTVEHE
jgi:hypothetical protein